jgi:hypothetical protein
MFWRDMGHVLLTPCKLGGWLACETHGSCFAHDPRADLHGHTWAETSVSRAEQAAPLLTRFFAEPQTLSTALVRHHDCVLAVAGLAGLCTCGCCRSARAAGRNALYDRYFASAMR